MPRRRTAAPAPTGLCARLAWGWGIPGETRPRPSTGALGGDLSGIPASRRYCLRQDRIVLTPCVQTAIDPLALLEQAGFPCSDAGDALLIRCPGRFDFKLGLICKTPAGVSCARSGVPRPKHMGLFWPSNPQSPILFCWRAKPSCPRSEYYTGWVRARSIFPPRSRTELAPGGIRHDQGSCVAIRHKVEICGRPSIFTNATLEEARNFFATVSGENIRAAGDYHLFRRHDPRGGLGRPGRAGSIPQTICRMARWALRRRRSDF